MQIEKLCFNMGSKLSRKIFQFRYSVSEAASWKYYFSKFFVPVREYFNKHIL